MSKPEIKTVSEAYGSIYMQDLRKAVTDYFSFLEQVKDGRPPDKLSDYEHYIFKEVINIFCGEESWKYIEDIFCD